MVFVARTSKFKKLSRARWRGEIAANGVFGRDISIFGAGKTIIRKIRKILQFFSMLSLTKWKYVVLYGWTNALRKAIAPIANADMMESIVAVTLSDIAKDVGVNTSTVSIVMNRKPRQIKISQATREKIFQAAEKMNYRPNLLARGLAQGKTHTIGFLTGSPDLKSVSAMETTLDDHASETGYGVYIAHTRGELDLTVKRANEFVDRGVDGLIIRGAFPSIPTEELKARLNFPVPTVLLSISAPKHFPCRQVCGDNAVGVARAVDHLYELGHRGIYMFRGCWKGWEHDLRFEGFRKAVNEHGLGDPEQRIYEVCAECTKKVDGHAALDVEGIYSNTENFLQTHPDCTAILCASDVSAFLVFQALSRLGVRIPQDISIVGFGNEPLTLYSLPPLSTVAIPVDKLIYAAFDMLMDEIDTKDDKPREKIIPTEYISRQSTGPVRKN
ncbi:MAG: LacI family transcriptional regulator [Phycisphaerae bacterium]|nr:LacI family transcriptional regulator [Phycisphaerae bacterium]